ncbi:MAG: hypothetical protein ACRENP_30420, partial [Longimicrobiales bacterium]
MMAPFGITAQEPQPIPPLMRSQPTLSWGGCPASEKAASVTPAQRQDAERLAEAATQAALLGDKAAVLDLLTRAAQADPTVPGIAYRAARALDENERSKDALALYCRYLLLVPDAADATEVRERARVLGSPQTFAVPAVAARAFETGIYMYDAGKLAEAEASFEQASESARQWNAPIFNRAVIRLKQGRTSAAMDDLRRFLEMSPGSAEFNSVLDLLATLRRAAPQYSASGALLKGLLVPGLGQLTTGRTGRGFIYLGIATGALAAGIGVTRLDVDCLSPPVNGQCPSDRIASAE